MNIITIDPEKREKPISSTLYGLFFEDINYGGDGGLYAELIANRSFSYYDREQRRDLRAMCWERLGDAALLYDFYPVAAHSGQSYKLTELVLRGSADAGVRNTGFCGEGFCLRAGAGYRLRVLGSAPRPTALEVSVTDVDGAVLLRERLVLEPGEAADHRLRLIAHRSCDRAYLSLTLLEPGEIRLRFVSLFPEDTFHGRENGLRKGGGSACAWARRAARRPLCLPPTQGSTIPWTIQSGFVCYLSRRRRGISSSLPVR